MTEQELIDFCTNAGIERSEMIVRNAPFFAEEFKMKPINSLERLLGLFVYLAIREMKGLKSKNPAHFGMAAYDASAKLHDVYLLSCKGIMPVSQSELFNKE